MSISDYSQYYQDAGQRYGVDPNLLMAQGQVESGGNPNAVSDAGAIGIAQLMPATAKSLGVDPKDPKQAIDGQARLMAENINRYGDISTALKAYDGGTNPNNWNNSETQNYPAKVLKNYKGTQMAQNDTAQDTPLAAALKAYKDDSNKGSPASSSGDSNDTPLAAALKAYKDEPEAESVKPPVISTNEDLLKTIPSAVAKGVGIIPQLPAMAGNAVANSLGYATGKILGVSPEMQNKLNNVSPFYTGNTLPDALIQSGKAIVTGNPRQQNPLSGDILYNPQTTPGKLLQAAIEGGIAGPVAGGAGISSALGGVAAEGASQTFPNNPLIPLVAGGLTYAGAKGIGNSVTPTPLSTDQATLYKNAEDGGSGGPGGGIKIPTSMMTGGANLLERMAGKADTSEMTSQINKKVVDMIGANDNGANHTEISQQAFLDAKQNNGVEIGRVDSSIGNVPLDNHINNITKTIVDADQPRFYNISDKIDSLKNPDGTISAENIRQLTGEGSALRRYANSSNEDISEPAQNIIKSLKSAIQENATPEQLSDLSAVNNKYKLMSDFEKVARESGVGLLTDPAVVRDVINKSYDGVNNYQTPAKSVSNLLNTAIPKKGYINPNSTGGSPFAQSNGLTQAEVLGSLLSPHPVAGLAMIATPKILSKGAAAITNSAAYRNRLLQNAQ